jgi:hypothetical protein
MAIFAKVVVNKREMRTIIVFSCYYATMEHGCSLIKVQYLFFFKHFAGRL